MFGRWSELEVGETKKMQSHPFSSLNSYTNSSTFYDYYYFWFDPIKWTRTYCETSGPITSPTTRPNLSIGGNSESNAYFKYKEISRTGHIIIKRNNLHSTSLPENILLIDIEYCCYIWHACAVRCNRVYERDTTISTVKIICVINMFK